MSSTQQMLRCLDSSNGCQTGKHCDVDSPSAPSLTVVRRALPLAELSRSGARGIGFFRLTAQRGARYGSFGKVGSPRSGIPSAKVAQRILCFFSREERETPKRGGPAVPRGLATAAGYSSGRSGRAAAAAATAAAAAAAGESPAPAAQRTSSMATATTTTRQNMNFLSSTRTSSTATTTSKPAATAHAHHPHAANAARAQPPHRHWRHTTHAGRLPTPHPGRASRRRGGGARLWNRPLSRQPPPLRGSAGGGGGQQCAGRTRATQLAWRRTA